MRAQGRYRLGNKLMHEPPETQAILQRMDEVRRDLDEGVQDVVEGARHMGEWRSYVKTYPWVCLGAALVVGYLIVPRRRVEMERDVQKVVELANPNRLITTVNLPPKATPRGMLLAFVGNLVLRGVSSYFGQQVGKFFVSQAVKSNQDDQP